MSISKLKFYQDIRVAEYISSLFTTHFPFNKTVMDGKGTWQNRSLSYKRRNSSNIIGVGKKNLL